MIDQIRGDRGDMGDSELSCDILFL